MKIPIRFRVDKSNIKNTSLLIMLDIQAFCLEKFLFLISKDIEATVILTGREIDAGLRTCVMVSSPDRAFQRFLIEEIIHNNTWLHISHINCNCDEKTM